MLIPPFTAPPPRRDMFNSERDYRIALERYLEIKRERDEEFEWQLATYLFFVGCAALFILGLIGWEIFKHATLTGFIQTLLGIFVVVGGSFLAIRKIKEWL